MSLDYGDVSVEHIGPKYGSNNGHEKVFIVFKGRVIKENISLKIVEPISRVYHPISEFSLNANIICFTIPLIETVAMQPITTIEIHLFYDQELLAQSIFTFVDLIKGKYNRFVD